MSDLIKDLTIPLFMGAIGWITNWSGIWMLFHPVQFKGFRLPGLAGVVDLLPRKVQQIPGVMHGGIGWQGIIPSRAAKMGSIAVDKGIAKVGGPGDFYDKLDPDVIAEHILKTSTSDVHDLVDRTMEREYPQLWRDLPPRAKRIVHDRVEAQLPEVVHEVTDRIGENIDQLLDVKLMVIDHIEARPELANRIFQEVGDKELRFIINFGFFFGFALGIPVVFIMHLLPMWWVLLVLGTLVGWATNWLAISMIFEPVQPRRILGRWTWQGLFLKRQKHAATAYADVIAEEIVTVRNIGEELMNGPRSDRTRTLIEQALRPALDRTAGQLRPLVRAAVGTREYDTIRDTMASEGVDYTMTPLMDEDFNRRQSEQIHELIATRMGELPPEDFSEMLRSAMREDEWLLILHGAVLGLLAGGLHLLIFGV